VVVALEKLGKAGLPADQQAALERVVITGSPELKMGDWAVTPETLAKEPAKAVALLEGKLPELWQEHSGDAWLVAAAERWRKYWPRVEALGCGTSKEKALPWIIGPTEQLTARATELLGRYVGSKEPAVQALWERGDWATAQCVALCVADEAQLLTESEKQLWEDLQWVKGVLGQPSQEEMQQAEKLLRQNDWAALAGILPEVRDPLNREIIKKHTTLGPLLDKEEPAFQKAVALCVYVQGLEFKRQKGGTVVAWGDNEYGQTTVPVGLSGVTAIAAGYGHTVALKSDGTVVAWGSNYKGKTTVPAGLSRVTAIAAGVYHTVALKLD
jgi:hypothetical protein